MTTNTRGWGNVVQNERVTPKGERNKRDLYPTPREATLALIDLELHKEMHVWECASGLGHISKVLCEYGIKTESTDIAASEYGFGKDADFLLASELLADVVVTNPPYSHLTNFIIHGLSSLKPRLFILHVPLNSLLTVGRRRAMEELGFPRTVYVFVPTLKVDAKLDGKPTPSIFNHTWAVWERGYKGPTTIQWVDWRKYK